MEKQHENMSMGTIFWKEKERAFQCSFGTLKHPVYGFSYNFLSITTTSYRKGDDQFRGWADLAKKTTRISDFENILRIGGFWTLSESLISSIFQYGWSIFICFEVQMAEINSEVCFDFFSDLRTRLDYSGYQ